jgi:hypothetical protein
MAGIKEYLDTRLPTKSFFIAVLAALAIFSGMVLSKQRHHVFPRSKMVHSRTLGVPEMGEAPLLLFNALPTKMPREAVHQFLEADFSHIEDLAELPPAVLTSLTKQGGSRLVIANPGQDFPYTSLSYDEDRRWLLFAGLAGDRGFLHYQEVGLQISYGLVLFRINLNGGVIPVWQGECRGAAKNLEELKSAGILNGACSHVLPPIAFVQPPLSADGSTVFPAKTKTIPVKFTYINCDEPTCVLPQGRIELSRPVWTKEAGRLVPVDKRIYSTQSDGKLYFASNPATGEYVYNIAASQLRRGKYQVQLIVGPPEEMIIGNATFSIQ